MRFLLLCLAACPSGDDTAKDGDTEVGHDSGNDTGDDTGTDTDTDTGDDTAVDTGDDTGELPPPELVAIEWTTLPATDITTRDTLALQVTASFSDGSSTDASAMVSYVSSDEMVLKVYEPGVGQPIWAGSVTVTATLEGHELSATANVTLASATTGDLVFNEVLADGTVDGDPNGDGNPDAVEDEFVEIANASDVTVDLSGYTLVEEDLYYLPRHTFAEGTVLRAGEAIVVFGGGDTSSLAPTNCTAVVAVNGDSALEYGLALNNEGENMSLVDTAGTTVAGFAYGDGTDIEAIEDASYVLSPEVYGTDYTHHTYATGSTGDFSACAYVDGTAYAGHDARYSP